jgi:hypothetical protein
MNDRSVTKKSGPIPVTEWSVTEVYKWVKEDVGEADVAERLKEKEVRGRTLVAMTVEDYVDVLGIQILPARTVVKALQAKEKEEEA